MVSSILNNFMTNLSPMQVGAFNPIIDNRYGDFASAQNEKQRQQDKVRQMIEQAEAEGRPLSQSEASLASMLEPNVVSGYNNNLTTQSDLRTNEINQQQEISKLENEEILKIANKLESTDDPLMKKVYYEQFKRRATQAGFFDETDPQEYSEEAENALIGYRDKVLEQAKDARSYGGTPAPLQVSNAIRKALDAGDLPQANAIALSAKIFDKGQEFKDTQGTIGNIEGYVPSVQDKAFGQGYGTQSGKDVAYSRQGQLNEQNKVDYKTNADVNKANQIDRNKSLPPAVQKQIKETQDIINVTNRSIGRGIDLYDKIDNGTLNLGLARNAINNALNGIGSSTEESRSLSELQTYVNELANNVQLLAKGTQTEGDAQRAKNIILSGDSDEMLVKE